jgi:glutaminase
MPAAPIERFLRSLHAKYADLHDGGVATYIPELAKADPDWFGICVATVDGFMYAVGDVDQAFTIQSISKPFVYGLVLDDRGTEYVLSKVGVEPSGDAFNAISLHKSTGRPLNPMINAGAIATTGQVVADTPAERSRRILEMFAKYTGRPMRIDEAVYQSESLTGHRNRAIGHLLRNFDVLTGDPTADVDVYFQQCSLLVHCRDLALMAATLANQGINPITGERAIRDEHVESVLSVMASCGMYDSSGGWIYNVGMPAKSGVAGGVLAVLPGQLGIGIFSPRLDEQGNSVRALEVCRELSRHWALHQFNPPYCPQTGRRLVYTSADRNSSRMRHPADYARLERLGRVIVVVELQGNLAFASIEPILRQLDGGSAIEARSLILDFHHVSGINDVAGRLLAELAGDLRRRGTNVSFTHAQRLPSLRDAVESHLGNDPLVADLFRFSSTDAALEWCEDELLEAVEPERFLRIHALREFELTTDLTEEELDIVAALLAPRRFADGEHLMRQGEAAGSLFLIFKGIVAVQLGTGGIAEQRLASCSTGTMVGEMAFLDGKERSADVVAEGEVECGELSVRGFAQLEQSAPGLHARVLRNIALALAAKLRKANRAALVLGAVRDQDGA